jgi:hypothetical protein
LFQENKSFGAITICIHPLMYKKLCQEQLFLLFLDDIGSDFPKTFVNVIKVALLAGSSLIRAWVICETDLTWMVGAGKI